MTYSDPAPGEVRALPPRDAAGSAHGPGRPAEHARDAPRVLLQRPLLRSAGHGERSRLQLLLSNSSRYGSITLLDVQIWLYQFWLHKGVLDTK